MVSKLLTFLTLAVAIHATPLSRRQEPKAAKGKGSGSGGFGTSLRGLNTNLSLVLVVPKLVLSSLA
jgi:hypothetical protein